MKSERKPIPAIVFWLTIVFISIAVISLLAGVFLLIMHRNGLFLIGFSVIVAVLCYWESIHYAWEVGRSLVEKECGFLEYTYYMPVSVMGFSKTTILFKSLSSVVDTDKSFILKGEIILTDSPYKPKSIDCYKLEKIFVDNSGVCESFRGLLKSDT